LKPVAVNWYLWKIARILFLHHVQIPLNFARIFWIQLFGCSHSFSHKCQIARADLAWSGSTHTSFFPGDAATALQWPRHEYYNYTVVPLDFDSVSTSLHGPTRCRRITQGRTPSQGRLEASLLFTQRIHWIDGRGISPVSFQPTLRIGIHLRKMRKHVPRRACR
jgi:hypothetical protein